MVATDGHRLSYAQRKAPLKVTEPQRVLVPRKAIQELARLLETEDSRDLPAGGEPPGLHAWAAASLASKMIEGQFPAFEKVIAPDRRQDGGAGARAAWPPPSAA